MQELWTEKYRPDTVENYVFRDQAQKEQVQGWIKGKTVIELNDNLKKFIEKEGYKIDFEKCINDKKIEDFVLNDRIEGAKKFKVNSTPAIIINNKRFDKSLNYKNLKKSLEKLI